MFDASKNWGQIGDNHCKKVHFLTIFIISPIFITLLKPIKTQVNKILQKSQLNSHNPKVKFPSNTTTTTLQFMLY